MNRDLSKGSLKPNALIQALRDWRNKVTHNPAREYHDVLEHLGTAVIMRWAHLPREVQRELFGAAVDMNEPKADNS